MVAAFLVMISAIAFRSAVASPPRCVHMSVSCRHSPEQLFMMQERGIKGDAECAHELSVHYKMEEHFDRPRTLLWSYIAAVNGSVHAAASLETYRQHLNYGASEFSKELLTIKFDSAEQETGVETYAKFLMALMDGDETSEKSLLLRLARAGVALPREGYVRRLRDKTARSLLPFRCVRVAMPESENTHGAPSVEYWIRVQDSSRAGLDATYALECTVFFCGVDVKRWQDVLGYERCREDTGTGSAVVFATYPEGSEYFNYDICIMHVERFFCVASQKLNFPVRVSKYVDAEGKGHVLPTDEKDAVRKLACLILSDLSTRKVRRRQTK